MMTVLNEEQLAGLGITVDQFSEVFQSCMKEWRPKYDALCSEHGVGLISMLTNIEMARKATELLPDPVELHTKQALLKVVAIYCCATNVEAGKMLAALKALAAFQASLEAEAMSRARMLGGASKTIN